MANILQSLGDAIERQQQRKHENNMEVLRAIYTRPGMIVLGVILLGAALALIWPQIAPEATMLHTASLPALMPLKRAKRSFWPVSFISKPAVVLVITYQTSSAITAA